MTLEGRVASYLSTSVNGASLAALRFFFGMIMALEAFSLFRPSESTSGQIMLETYFIKNAKHIHFPYSGFEWLPLLPATYIYAMVITLGLAGVFVATGFLYRISAVLLFFIWGYLYVVESTRTYWMSYYYLELLLAFLLIWLPAARCFSVDKLLKRNQPNIREIPFWPIVVIRGQLVITYFYAGVAKLNLDWIQQAQPVKYFLSQAHVSVSIPLIDRLIHTSSFAFFLSYSGLIFDLSIGFILLVRRTRWIGLALMLVFHSTNSLLLFNDLLWFPLLGITTATIFLDPDWPDSLLDRIKRTSTNQLGSLPPTK